MARLGVFKKFGLCQEDSCNERLSVSLEKLLVWLQLSVTINVEVKQDTNFSEKEDYYNGHLPEK